MELKAEVHNLPHNNNVTTLDFSADSSLLTVGDSQGILRLYSAHTGLTELTAFVSHTDELDPESQRCETKTICSVRYLYSLPTAVVLLAANEKTIKLWRAESRISVRPSCRRRFSHGHECCIHSLSVCSSRQHFLSADDLRINLWDLEHEAPFCLADFTPSKITFLREVLLSACFHPSNPALLLFSSTTGKVRVADLRSRACALPAAIEMKSEAENYSDLAVSVTGADFSASAPLIFARDVMRVNIWDMRESAHPVFTVPILAHYYESEVDKYQVKSCGESFVTGSHNSEVVLGNSHGPPLRAELGLGPCTLSTVTCDPMGSQVFAAALNKLVVVHTPNQNLASF